jgi:hypothetical protein
MSTAWTITFGCDDPAMLAAFRRRAPDPGTLWVVGGTAVRSI